jgi:hypothetical protein
MMVFHIIIKELFVLNSKIINKPYKIIKKVFNYVLNYMMHIIILEICFFIKSSILMPKKIIIK